MALQTGIGNPIDVGVAFEILGNLLRIAGVAIHAQVERFDASQCVPRVEGTGKRRYRATLPPVP